jgi:hypothetical protein
MNYTIKHGNIAAVCEVTKPDGTVVSLIYLADGKLPVTHPSNTPKDFEALPLAVQAAVNRQFGQVFSLPIGRRDEWVKAQVPFEVEA